jgi:hypothetical protein
MGRTRNRKRTKPISGVDEPASPEAGPSKITFTAAQLVGKADDLLAACDYDLCRQFCQRALQQDPDNVLALEMLGSAELESGLVEEAQEVRRCPHRSPPRADSLASISPWW